MDNKSAVNKLKNNFITKYLRGDGKIFSIVFFVIVLLLLSGIITEFYINKTNNNWKEIVSDEINNIYNEITENFKDKERYLIGTLKKLKFSLNVELNKADEVYKIFIKEINKSEYDNFSIEIYAPNGKLIGWNNSSKFSHNELFPLPAIVGETFFLEKDLVYYYSLIDTFHFQSDEFYVFISLPIEKKYKLKNKYFEEISIFNSLSEKFQTDVKVDLNPYTSPAVDGRKYSFELLNNKNKKIGLVIIDKPTIKSKISEIKNLSSTIQSTIVLIGLIIIGLGLSKDYKNLTSSVSKFVFLLVYLIVFRLLLFWFNIPAKFFYGGVVEPANYSSTFAFGIVKSPLELFITNIFVLIIGLKFFHYSIKYFRENKIIKNKIISIFITLILLILFPLLLRAFASTIQSVVFDTKLRYFKNFEILPDIVVLIMQVNVLLIGVSFIFLLLGIIFLLNKLIFSQKIRTDFKQFLIIASILSSITILFYFISLNPLYNALNLLVLLLTILWIYFIMIRDEYNQIKFYLLILLAASFNSVILLNYFDTTRERESVKNIALEINRLNEQLIKFYLNDNINKLYNAHSEQNLLLRKDINFNSLSFIYWSKSSLHKEELNSFIAFYDRYGKLLGGFNIGFEIKDNIRPIMNKFLDNTFIDESKPDSLVKRIIAYSKYIEQGVPQLVLSSGIDFKVGKLGGTDYPEFLKSELNIINQYINLEKVKIFQFNDSELVQFYGDVYPNREQIKHIFNVKLDSIYNDGWTQIKFGDEIYEAYIFKTFDNENIITNVVAVAENKFGWSLFNFFKVFIIHSIIIFIIISVLTIAKVKRIVISFKSKLLLLFLFISIIPITVLGVYNRNILNERSTLNIQNELKQKLNLVENNLATLVNQNVKLIDAANRIYNTLNISFNIFEKTDLVFSSNKVFYDIGLLNEKLNSSVYYKLNYDRFREYYLEEQIEKYKYYSFYKLIKLKDKNYILNVNQAFNKSNTVISTTDFDILLFGIYSLMLVIIVFSSTLMANQISSPIQRLTKAAEALGRGDLNIRVEHNAKGEIKELIDGFNKMAEELKKNQIELAEYERESAWKEMAKQVAHEIKNPLTPMKLALQQLVVTFQEKREDFDKLFDKVSNTILNQIENLSQIATEFSRVAKMPSLKFEKFDLLILLNELSSIYVSEKIKIEIKSTESNLLIENDKNQLSRVFINLIRNSIQANANNIIIEIKKSKKFIEIFIKDNGSGIEKVNQEKIFVGNFSTKKQGMGLGLKISKKFLGGIGGDIILTNSDVNGTTFKIVLPYE